MSASAFGSHAPVKSTMFHRNCAIPGSDSDNLTPIRNVAPTVTQFRFRECQTASLSDSALRSQLGAPFWEESSIAYCLFSGRQLQQFHLMIEVLLHRFLRAGRREVSGLSTALHSRSALATNILIPPSRLRAERMSSRVLLEVETNRDRPKSAPYPRLKNSKKTSKCQVFSFTVLENFSKKNFRKNFILKKMDQVARRGPLARAPGALKGGHFRNCQHFCRS